MNDEPELRLLLQEESVLERPGRRIPIAGAVLGHVVLILAALYMPVSDFVPVNGPRIEFARATPLVAPPSQLTQKDPGTGKASLEVNLEGLVSKSTMPQPTVRQNAGAGSPIAPRPIEAPPAAAEAPAKQSAAPPKPEPEQIARALPTPQPPAAGVPDSPQIRIETAEQPRLPVSTSGTATGTSTGAAPTNVRIPAIQRPGTVEEMARQAVRPGGASGGLTVVDTDERSPGFGSSLTGNQPLRQGSSLELLSDPKGVDFKPYLIRVLAAVKQNWLAVMPESARLGQRGQVQVQFAVNRDGSVPKLVIASPSGLQAFDRAAVAGVSASNPFPPLPSEFQGLQIRLQLTFTYNAPPK
jgi:TonB family protein